MHPRDKPRAMFQRVKKARNFPYNTCPASRHVQMVAEALMKGKVWPSITEEPENIGSSMLSVVISLYEARTRVAELEERAK